MIKIKFDHGEAEFDEHKPIDISIPLIFNGPQPNAYGVPPAASEPCASGELVGDTRRGGSCNFEQYTLIPHCNGTHTECVGHITHDRISIRECLRDVFMPAVLVSVRPQSASAVGDTYAVAYGDDDLVITRSSLEQALVQTTSRVDLLLAGAERSDLPVIALIVRTLPNDTGKLSRRYGDMIPPYFSTEAVRHIVDCGFRHLLVDVPSIDRLFDEGKLSNHRIFWDVGAGSHAVASDTRMNSTITELIRVPDEIPDGRYVLNLQIAPFAADASPSRPVIFGAV